MVVNASDTKKPIIYITVEALEDCEVDINIIEGLNVFQLDYGNNIKFVADKATEVGFILDSAYAPSGSIIEVCEGTIESYFSYYHLPQIDYAFANKLNVA